MLALCPTPHLLVPGLIGCLLCAPACSGTDAPTQAAAKPTGPPPALVTLGTATAGGLTDRWTFLGQAEAALSAELAAAVTGHVLEVSVSEGDRVRTKQPLVRLDAAKVRAEVAASTARESGLQAELSSAKRQLERARTLAYPAISQPELERFELAVDNLSAQLETQRAETRRLAVDLSHHTVRAPFSGVVSMRAVDPGAWVNVGAPVLALVSLDKLELHVPVSAELGARLTVGDTATIIGPTPAEATILGIVPALDTATRTMRIRLAPTRRPSWLLPGMPVEVEFTVALEGSGVTVPRDALVRGPVSVRVIKVIDGTATPVQVQVVATAKAEALVRGEGLVAGDQVVVRGNERLRPGQPVRVAE